MNIAKGIEEKINKIKEGDTFTYQNLSIKKEEYTATAKALERLIKKEKIKRISTGVFYKPKQTAFGELKPNEEELIKPYLFKNGKRIAYITGVLIYNKMGLTTQIPKTIKIASRDKRITVSIGNIKGTPVKSYADITDKNYYLLEFLDALKEFNKIPNLDKKSAIKILTNKLTELTSKETKQLIKLGLLYPPRVIAFLGALLENLNNLENIDKLKESLNPLSEYKIGISCELLPTSKNWNIK
jgi:hypothetical protein